jgi:hypothetical protein
MSTRSLVLAVILTGIASAAAVSAAAAQSGGPPRIDLEKVCRAGASEIFAVFGDTGQDVFGTCMQDEEMARDMLKQNWGDFPAIAKQRCVQPKEYLPSYVEWTACLELTRDVLKMRQERSAAATAASNSADRECPIVKTNSDGNIEWIDTCSSRRRR